MPPKFRRYLSEEDVSEAQDGEKEKLLREDEEDDFFLKYDPKNMLHDRKASFALVLIEQGCVLPGPSAGDKTLTVQDKKLRRVQFQVDEVSNIMKGNIEKIIERGERLEDLGDKSDALATHADQFRSTAKKMQSRMWWRNMKVKIVLAVIILVIMLIIFVPIIVRNS